MSADDDDDHSEITKEEKAQLAEAREVKRQQQRSQQDEELALRSAHIARAHAERSVAVSASMKSKGEKKKLAAEELRHKRQDEREEKLRAKRQNEAAKAAEVEEARLLKQEQVLSFLFGKEGERTTKGKRIEKVDALSGLDSATLASLLVHRKDHDLSHQECAVVAEAQAKAIETEESKRKQCERRSEADRQANEAKVSRQQALARRQTEVLEVERQRKIACEEEKRVKGEQAYREGEAKGREQAKQDEVKRTARAARNEQWRLDHAKQLEAQKQRDQALARAVAEREAANKALKEDQSFAKKEKRRLKLEASERHKQQKAVAKYQQAKAKDEASNAKAAHKADKEVSDDGG
jgi:hypothetical protein